MNTSVQTQKFTGNWKLNTEKMEAIWANFDMALEVSQNITELTVKNITDRNVLTTSYNLEGKDTTSEIKDELEHSVFTHNLKLENDKTLLLNSNRLMDNKLIIKTNEIWELGDDERTLKVKTHSELLELEMENSKNAKEPIDVIWYYTKQ